MSSQRRQIMQPWPLCLVSTISKNEDRSIFSKYYTRVPSLARYPIESHTISEDCSSNTTLLTNTSPFNSQHALITNNSKSSASSKTTNYKNSNSARNNYYTNNLRHENDLQTLQVYNPLEKNSYIENHKQLEPLVSKNQVVIEEAKMLMDSELQIEEKDDEPTKKPVIIPMRSGKQSKEMKKRPIYFSQILAALSVSLGSLVVGFSCSYSSPAIVSMNATAPFEVNSQTGSWIGSILPLCALLGGIAGGPLIEYVGRRNTILATAFPFIAAWLFIATATNVALVIIGRGLCGFCVGIASLSLPVYLGETIQPEVRGTLGLFPTAFGNIGILICFVAGRWLDWSQLAYLGACLPVPYLLLMFRIPETPRWYISKGRTKRARKSLEWLRGKDADITEELAAVERTHVDSETTSSTQSPMKEILKTSHIKPLMISLGLMFFQQLSGINVVIFYTVQIFKSSGSTIEESDSTIAVGIVNFISTFVAAALIDRLGRKILLYISNVSMIVTLAPLGAFFYLKEHNVDVSEYGWVPLASLAIYVIGFSLGFGPIPWLMMGEILPARIRGPAASIATGFNWFCTFIVTKAFNDIVAIIGLGGTFWVFAAICVVGLLFVIFWVPETRGRSLEEIEKRLTGPVRRMSAVANMKPMPAGC